MNEQDELAQKRDAIIGRIKQVFPKKPVTKGKKGVKITQGRSDYSSRKLIEMFEGKQWEDMVAYPGIVYYLSDIDYLRAITDKAYRYFQPAFLVATLKEPSAWIYTSNPLEKIYSFGSQFNLDELDAMIAYFEYQIEYRELFGGGLTYEFENMLLHLLFRRDELAKEWAK
ncbi:MAG: hypothetical protein ABI690_03185 [Chloroflexota bacterium]